MGTLTDQNTFDATVYELETSDLVEGGPGGVSNNQAQNLANRTRWLYNQVQSIEAELAQLMGEVTALTPVTPQVVTSAQGVEISTGYSGYVTTSGVQAPVAGYVYAFSTMNTSSPVTGTTNGTPNSIVSTLEYFKSSNGATPTNLQTDSTQVSQSHQGVFQISQGDSFSIQNVITAVGTINAIQCTYSVGFIFVPG